MKIKTLLLSVILIALLPTLGMAQNQATEIRAVWLTTNWHLDWPKPNTSVKQQKAELISILDKVKAMNFNTVLFQARVHGAALYQSKYQPKSRFYNQSDNFDPLAFAIDECHKRGMECHAWLITFPLEPQKTTGKGKRRKAVKENKPEYYTAFEFQWYLDPGHPETKKHLINIVEELVTNYDVDGIHFDYIRYPSQSMKFPDDFTYKRYGRGANLYDWRRDNITKIVSEMYDKTKSIKNWVQVSSSPLGRYKVLPEVNANDGWTAYGTVFQDAGKWMRDGKHDIMFPMMYYRKRNFEPFLDDWVANSGGRHIVPGLGVYQMMKEEQNWPVEDVMEQIDYSRANGAAGAAHFRVGNILNDLKGIKSRLDTAYRLPAKLPPMPWLSNEIPDAPTNLQVYEKEKGYIYIEWQSEQTEGGQAKSEGKSSDVYTIYSSDSETFDFDNPRQIVAAQVGGNRYLYTFVADNDVPFGRYYTVTASNRYHNESKPAEAAFFVHWNGEK